MRLRHTALLAIVPALLAPDSADAQIRWAALPLSTGVQHHAMAYDSNSGRLYRFGGQFSQWATTSANLDELIGDRWVPVTFGPMSSRQSAGLTFDERRNLLVMFGGRDSSNAPLADTWVWNGNEWSQATPPSSPPARTGHAMVYDAARGQTVLFGGAGNGAPFGDTWVWDGTTWTRLSPASSPSPRLEHGMAYDSQRQRVVLFGGWETSAGPPLADTWEWDGVTWTRQTPATVPPARGSFAMAYHEARGRTVIFGGSDGGLRCVDNRPWEWDGFDWRREVIYPGATAGNAMAYDARGRRMVLKSGKCPTAPGGIFILSQATWEYVTVDPALFGTAGTGCQGTAGQLTLNRGAFSLPWAGEILDLDLAPISSGPGVAAFGFLGASTSTWGAMALPFELGGLGAAGCSLYTGIEISIPLTPVAGTASWSIPIPTHVVFIGQRFFAQGMLLGDPANPGRIVTSNLVVAEVGIK